MSTENQPEVNVERLRQLGVSEDLVQASVQLHEDGLSHIQPDPELRARIMERVGPILDRINERNRQREFLIGIFSRLAALGITVLAIWLYRKYKNRA